MVDERYLDYLRAMYGGKIRIPSPKDSQNAFEEYLTDAQTRLANDKLKPGENVRIVNNNRVQVSGQVAVMTVNGLVAKIIFEANPDREFFIEESFPLDWMYPHLLPHQLIFKINRQPLAGIPEALVLEDRKFWTQQQAQLIGAWLMPETSVQQVCDFALKVFGSNNLTGFKGDRRFVQSDYSINALFQATQFDGWALPMACHESEIGNRPEAYDCGGRFRFSPSVCLLPAQPRRPFFDM